MPSDGQDGPVVHLDMFGNMLDISDMCTIDHACSDLDWFGHIWTDLDRTGKILQDTKGHNGIYWMFLNVWDIWWWILIVSDGLWWEARVWKCKMFWWRCPKHGGVHRIHKRYPVGVTFVLHMDSFHNLWGCMGLRRFWNVADTFKF